MVLVDTSVWILQRSADALFALANDESLAICPPILQELLQGAWDQGRMNRVHSIADNSVMLDSPVPIERFEVAAAIYRIARAQSFTIRSSNDCLIAAIAIHHDLLLLHSDRDFDYIAQVFPLRARRVNPSLPTARS